MYSYRMTFYDSIALEEWLYTCSEGTFTLFVWDSLPCREKMMQWQFQGMQRSEQKDFFTMFNSTTNSIEYLTYTLKAQHPLVQSFFQAYVFFFALLHSQDIKQCSEKFTN